MQLNDALKLTGNRLDFCALLMNYDVSRWLNTYLMFNRFMACSKWKPMQRGNAFNLKGLKLMIGLVNREGKRLLKSNWRLLIICLGVGNVNIETEC